MHFLIPSCIAKCKKVPPHFSISWVALGCFSKVLESLGNDRCPFFLNISRKPFTNSRDIVISTDESIYFHLKSMCIWNAAIRGI